MKKPIIPNTLLTLTLITVLLLSNTPTAHAFKHKEVHETKFARLLIERVHDEHWNIVYAIRGSCSEERRANPKKFEEDITTALQILLQPLREYDTKLPIVNDFRFKKVPTLPSEIQVGADLIPHLFIYKEDLDNATFAVIDTCLIVEETGGSAFTGSDKNPFAIIFNGEHWDHPSFMSILIHELGHLFGLGDTYSGRGGPNPSRSTGGMDWTIGTQPASIMAMHLFYFGYDYISEDDLNGIVWLYKVYHEGLPLKDCFFPNYKFEEKPAGCIPKWPLIFEIRQGYEVLAIRILNQDPNIDVNQQDDLGNTALHYGVMGEHQKFVETLLEHGGVIMNRRNKAGKTPLSLAREIGNEEIITAIEEHKNRLRLAVDPQNKLATTWASLKER